jgi:hypothetical protein
MLGLFIDWVTIGGLNYHNPPTVIGQDAPRVALVSISASAIWRSLAFSDTQDIAQLVEPVTRVDLRSRIARSRESAAAKHTHNMCDKE